jgi:serine/threonine protein kinase
MAQRKQPFSGAIFMDQPHRYWPANNGRFAVLRSKLSNEDTRREDFEALPPRLKEGEALGPFWIEREIAAGATGTVYEALQPAEDRKVALKALSPHLALVPRAVARFEAESSLAGRVIDPCIAAVFERGKSRGYYFFAMELHGRNASEEVAFKAPVEKDESYFHSMALKFAGLARALERLHLQAIVHRDVKPENLLVAADRRLVLGDFGSALDGKQRLPILERSLWGTVSYMSPEQFGPHADPYDPRMDIYALGLSLYEVVTGLSPFPHVSQEELMRLKLAGALPLPRQLNGRLPLGLEALIRQAIEPNPRFRYPTAGNFAEDLERFAELKRGHRR